MLRLGLDSYSYRHFLAGRDPHAAAFMFLNKVKELGLDGCQFDPMHLDKWNERLVRYISEFCSDNGLYLELGSGGVDYDWLCGRIQLAGEVGARSVRTFVGWERGEFGEERIRELIVITIENFKRLAEVAEKAGVPLALENHEDLTSAEVVHILDAVDSPFIRACLDNGNALSVCEDPVDCTRTLAPYVANCHLKDWVITWDNGKPIRRSCPFGEGHGRVAEVTNILRQTNPDMPITIEQPYLNPEDPNHQPECEHELVKQSVEFMRRLGDL